MKALVFIALLTYSLLIVSILFVFLWRAFKTSYNTLGKWAKWVVLLMVIVVLPMVIAVVLPRLLIITGYIIIGLMTLGVAIISIVTVIPIIGSVIVPLIKAMPIIIMCLLLTMIFAIPIVGIIIGYYRGRYGVEPYPPYEQS